MINLLLSGCTGGMGGSVTKLVDSKLYDVNIVCGISSIKNYTYNYPVYKTYDSIPADIVKNIHVILDFSHPSLLKDILKFSIKNKTPIVLCTTGYSKDNMKDIKEASKKTPIFLSRNMSFGINLVRQLISQINKTTLQNYNIEIIEKHHNNKVDAPSGTALLFASDINAILDNEYKLNVGRNNMNEKRDNKEIGIHSIRCGNIRGEHEIILCSGDEEIIISHKAYSREVFSKSAINAVKFIRYKDEGIFTIKDII